MLVFFVCICILFAVYLVCMGNSDKVVLIPCREGLGRPLLTGALVWCQCVGSAMAEALL